MIKYKILLKNIFISSSLYFFLLHLTCVQYSEIEEWKRIKNKKLKKKKQIIFDSLIFELETNKEWVKAFISYCENGGHTGGGEKVTLNLTPPKKLNQHDEYLILACYEDKNLLEKINTIYVHIDSCKFLVDSALKTNYDNIQKEVKSNLIIQQNKAIKDLCLTIKDSFDEPIKQLKLYRNKP